MVLWLDVDKNLIDIQPGARDKSKYVYDGKPLRFQIPRGECTWGVSQYKALNLTVQNQDFIKWWAELERALCPHEPFKSNLQSDSLRIKIDEATYIFDENSNQVSPEVQEGLFRGQELSCLIGVESNYFFNETWGLTVRATQVRFYETTTTSEADEVSEPPVLKTGVCAFMAP